MCWSIGSWVEITVKEECYLDPGDSWEERCVLCLLWDAVLYFLTNDLLKGLTRAVSTYGHLVVQATQQCWILSETFYGCLVVILHITLT